MLSEEGGETPGPSIASFYKNNTETMSRCSVHNFICISARERRGTTFYIGSGERVPFWSSALCFPNRQALTLSEIVRRALPERDNYYAPLSVTGNRSHGCPSRISPLLRTTHHGRYCFRTSYALGINVWHGITAAYCVHFIWLDSPACPSIRLQFLRTPMARRLRSFPTTNHRPSDEDSARYLS